MQKMTMQKSSGELKYLILGATFRGCALACSLPDALVVEPLIHVGSDFVFCADAGDAVNYSPTTDPGRILRAELEKRQIITAHGVQVAALAPTFARFCLEKNLRVWFSSTLISRNGDEIQLATPSGITAVKAGKVIDARPHPKQFKFFTAFVSIEKPVKCGRYGDFELWAIEPVGRFSLRLRVDADCTIQHARELFATAWRNRSSELRDARLVWSSSHFMSDEFSNPLVAFDTGIKEAADYE